MQIPALKSVTVEVLVDNFFDVFEPSRPGVVERVVPGRLKKPLVAAHGLAFWITLEKDGATSRLLLDAANSPLPLMNNIEALEHNLEEVDAVVLSHGHPDHYGGLVEILSRRQGKLPVYFHKDCYHPKLLITPRGRIGPWKLDREALVQGGAEMHENSGPALVLDQVLLTGTVEASTPYETPLPGPKRVIAGVEENDPFTDEQALVAHVQGQGLVILGGCSHPGIVNMVKYAQKLTGVQEIAAIIGGFHLTAGGPDLIRSTIQGLKELNPKILLAGHCTGFKALTQLALAFPDTFMVSCVGTKVMIGG
ncbi:MAG: MBL fold metallo-hydrolase [Deltaproteobacteria bacterium]|nr:MBL fold metallo-hydrolase [Deltaproteobacteria bacterium]